MSCLIMNQEPLAAIANDGIHPTRIAEYARSLIWLTTEEE